QRRGLPGRASRILVLAVVVSFVVSLDPASALAVTSPQGLQTHTDKYIVTLRGGVDSTAVANEHHPRRGGTVSHVFDQALNGYAAQIPPSEVAAIRADPRVQSVVPDIILSLPPQPAFPKPSRPAVQAPSPNLLTGPSRAQASAGSADGPVPTNDNL